jgi:hypothetical protein
MATECVGWYGGDERPPADAVAGAKETHRTGAKTSAKIMAPNDLPIRRGDDTAELRARYDQLCTALTNNAGTNAAAAERVLQELQTLAQKIAFRESDRPGPRRQAAGPTPSATDEAPAPRGKSNVIAFRCRVKGQARENPRLSAALSALTDDVPLVHVGLATARPDRPVDAPKAAGDRTSAAAEPPMVAAVAKQGAELERLVRKSEDQTRVLERLEQQLGQGGEPSSELSAEVAALRSAATLQGEQLVSLATAVHRLAKLLAAHAPVEPR